MSLHPVLARDCEKRRHLHRLEARRHRALENLRLQCRLFSAELAAYPGPREILGLSEPTFVPSRSADHRTSFGTTDRELGREGVRTHRARSEPPTSHRL